MIDILKWKFKIGPQEETLMPDAPDEPADCVPVARDAIAVPPVEGWRVVWLGHASFLVQGCGLSLLIDPVFADYCSPFPIEGLIRRTKLPLALEDLPHIDAVLLTHNHYDHLDLATLRTLRGRTQFIIAEGHAEWLAEKLRRPVDEVPWGHTFTLVGRGGEEVLATSTPAQHFAARTPFDRNRGHWCGWLIEGGGCKIWHAGDSGYCPAFSAIGERHGPIDFGMIPIGAYFPRSIMKPIHMNPEEAVQAFHEAGCRRAVGMHWGSFTLTDEPMREPVIRLAMEVEKRGMAADTFTTEPVGTIWQVKPARKG